MPNLPATGTFVTRLWRPGIGPAVVLHRAGALIDVLFEFVASLRMIRQLARL